MCVSGGGEDHEEGSWVSEQVVLQTGVSEKAGATEGQHLSRLLKVERMSHASILKKSILD